MVVLDTPLWNVPPNSMPILNENCPIRLIHLCLRKDPFPWISYSHIPVRNSRAVSLELVCSRLCAPQIITNLSHMDITLRDQIICRDYFGGSIQKVIIEVAGYEG